MTFDDEDLPEFVDEALELAESIETKLIILEKNPSNNEAIDSIFRNMHTIKGSSALMELKDLENLTHAAENLMARIQSGSTTVDSKSVELLIQTNDTIIDYVKGLQSDQNASLEVAGLIDSLSTI